MATDDMEVVAAAAGGARMAWGSWRTSPRDLAWSVWPGVGGAAGGMGGWWTSAPRIWRVGGCAPRREAAARAAWAAADLASIEIRVDGDTVGRI